MQPDELATITKRDCRTSDTPQSKRQPTRHQAALTSYLAAGQHLIFDTHRQRHGLDPYRAKPIRQVAAETGMSARTARDWLKRDHYDVWARWWPSFEVICEEMREEGRTVGAPSPRGVRVGDLPAPDPDAIAAAAEEYY